MTNQQKLTNYLKRFGWVNQRDLQHAFFYEMNPESVAREARRLAEQGEIQKRKNGKYIEYKLITGGQLKIC